MFDRDRDRTTRRRSRRPQAEALESRHLLVASLAPIADLTVPQALGSQVALDGGTGRAQSYAVTSDNDAIRATVARGQFLTIGVSHASSGATDPAFDGTLTFQLFEDLTPETASRIEALVTQGFYTAPTTGNTSPTKNFHRVVPGFVVQGGSVNGDGTGEVNQPGFPFDDEFVQPLVFTGNAQLAMANSGDDSNSSQFFITLASPRNLDYNHTIFGQLVAGQETLARMAAVALGPDGSTPITPILFTTTTLSPVSPDGVLHIDATGATAGATATVTVTATDPVDNTTATRTFAVSVGADLPANDTRPFLGPVSNQVVAPGQAATFQLTSTDVENDPLTYIVQGGKTPGSNPTFLPIQNATATVDANGLVTVTPAAGFTGVIRLLVGVRDQTNRLGAGASLDSGGNFDTQELTLTVTGTPLPTAQPVTVSTNENVAIPIQLTGTDANPGQTLTFALQSPPGNGILSGFDPQTGAVTYTPRQNFVGTDRFTYLVSQAAAPNLISETATVTINVEQVNVPPTALPSIFTVATNTSSRLQLQANTGNPEAPTQTLVYTIVTQPTNGRVTQFDAQQGTFVYTPTPSFNGTDTLTFRVRDVGEPAPNLDSEPATVTFNVVGPTGAVRRIGDVLVVTPLPRTDGGTNTIDVGLDVDGQITVVVNGGIDADILLRPFPEEIQRLVVYGSKARDHIVVQPDVVLRELVVDEDGLPVEDPLTPVTLDGGHGGRRNRLEAGGDQTREHGWFGTNTLVGGERADALIGRRGRARYRIGDFGVDSDQEDTVFAGEPRVRPRVKDGKITPPTGRFFRFARNNRLVALPTPPRRVTFQATPISRRRDEILSGIDLPGFTDPADVDDPSAAARPRANRRRDRGDS